MPRRYLVFAAVAAGALLCDQVTKAVARAVLVPEAIRPFIGGFWDWNLSFNQGVAFSIGHGSSWARLVFTVIGALACVAILVAVKRNAGPAAALGLVFAGALGNLIDRAAAGKVTDFIFWHIGEHRWPRFNIADAALLLGVAALLVADFTRKRHKTMARRSSA